MCGFTDRKRRLKNNASSTARVLYTLFTYGGHGETKNGMEDELKSVNVCKTRGRDPKKSSIHQNVMKTKSTAERSEKSKFGKYACQRRGLGWFTPTFARSCVWIELRATVTTKLPSIPS